MRGSADIRRRHGGGLLRFTCLKLKKDETNYDKAQKHARHTHTQIPCGILGAADLRGAFRRARLYKWCGKHRELIRDLIYAPSDFLWHEGAPETYGHGLNVWIRAVNDGVSAGDVAPYALTEFPGGIFLVATADESDKSDLEETVSGMFDWIRENAVFEYGDFPRIGMCNMPAADTDIDRALGIAQQQIFLPLKYREK